ncbi:MAG: undecaprenyl-diphosphate phosphatase [Acidimicrobiales bacterium]
MLIAGVHLFSHVLLATGPGGPGHVVAHVSKMTFFQAVVLGVLQGVSELFPVSSLGHAVVFPALFNWNNLVASESKPESFWLAFVVALHVGTALALVAFFWRDWKAIIGALVHSIRTRTITTPTERLGWLLVAATIPAGITGLILEHELRVLFTKPLAASIFLVINAFILFGGEVARRRAEIRERRGHLPPRELKTLDFKEAGVIGTAQVLALLAGISRSGITMVAGLIRGLDHEDAARFSFLLATPVILLAGIYKIPDLIGPLGDGVRSQALVGALCAFVAALISVRFLTRYFKTRTLWPFGLYCLVAGTFFVVRFA